MSELRYHPFLDTWVITAAHRQDRTYHPPPGFCPLCPTRDPSNPTEVPFDDYDIVVFENRFPSLSPNPPEPSIGGNPLLPVAPASGVCEVVCYTSRHEGSFAELPRSTARKLTRVWQERYCTLMARTGIEYVFLFENKGAVIGVTLSHPHGQIYAYPFVPAVPKKELESERRYFESNRRQLAADWLEQEMVDDQGARVVYANASFVALVPYFARYTYEIHVAARGTWGSLAPMSPRVLDDLADVLQTVAQTYDRLFGFSMPYVMAMHQFDADYTRFHVEFYPPHRTADKLKYLAGSEAGAGAFINDLLPEQAAEQLRAACPYSSYS